VLKTNTSSALRERKVKSNYLTVIPLNKIAGMKISLQATQKEIITAQKMLLD
jgi:hypothetical protein